MIIKLKNVSLSKTSIHENIVLWYTVETKQQTSPFCILQMLSIYFIYKD